MRKGALVDVTEGEFGSAGDPSRREEERFGRDSAETLCLVAFGDFE